MNFHGRLFHCVLLIFIVTSAGSIKRLKDRIYLNLLDNNRCIRILNGTHQFGCQSAKHGSFGVLQWIKSIADYQYVKNDPGGLGPFVVAMEMAWFANKSIVVDLQDSGKLNGILVILDKNESLLFSEDLECPNDVSGLYKNDPDYGSCRKGAEPWNDLATEYRFMDFKIPIFLVRNETEKSILRKKCYENFNIPKNGSRYPEHPVCAVDLLSFNLAAGSAEKCIRRSGLITGLEPQKFICEPLNGYNVYAFLPSTNKSNPLSDKSVLMLATRMDSFSMFSEYDPGAASSLGNVITMLTIVEALGRHKNFLVDSSKKTGKYLMPVVFNGESLDYMGSSRMIYDVQQKKFPGGKQSSSLSDQPALLSFNNLGLILEFNQVSMPDDDGYFLHVDPKSLDDQETKNIVENASKSLLSSGVINPKVNWNMRLPPSSVQRFLMINRTIPALVITDHEKRFKNKHYNSFTDNPTNIDREKAKRKISKLSSAISKFVFEWISDGQLPPNWQVNESLMDYWMDCCWNWPNLTCDVFNRISLTYPRERFDMYYLKRENYHNRTFVGTQGSWVEDFVQYSMSYLLGDRYYLNESKCVKSSFTNRTGQIYTYLAMADLLDTSTNKTYCYVSSVDADMIRSPAFEIDDYDFESGEYPTWMQSVGTYPFIRVFLVPSKVWEGSVLAVGLLVTSLSFIIVYVLSTGSDVIFAFNEVPGI